MASPSRLWLPAGSFATRRGDPAPSGGGPQASSCGVKAGFAMMHALAPVMPAGLRQERAGQVIISVAQLNQRRKKRAWMRR
jgi:hypothetical protein